MVGFCDIRLRIQEKILHIVLKYVLYVFSQCRLINQVLLLLILFKAIHGFNPCARGYLHEHPSLTLLRHERLHCPTSASLQAANLDIQGTAGFDLGCPARSLLHLGYLRVP